MTNIQYYKDLGKLNTFGMKVKARAFVEYDSVADFFDLDFDGLPRPLMSIGAGSNLLFTDDFKGTVLHGAIKFIEPIGGTGGQEDDASSAVSSGLSQEVLVSVGAGVVFDDFCKWSCENGLWGVENLSGIPGEVGASAVQNIGAYGAEAKDVIRTVYCYDLEEEEFVKFDAGECAYGYRDSVFKHPDIKGRYIVTHVVFVLSRDAEPKLGYGMLRTTVESFASGSEITPAVVRAAVLKLREEKLPDPSKVGNAGSFFKNPVVSMEKYRQIAADYDTVPHYDFPDGNVKIPAAWMIEQCGWKGRRMGGAAVWEKQPLVIVNYTGEAFPEEIIGLEKRIIESVETKFGVRLSPEVEHI